MTNIRKRGLRLLLTLCLALRLAVPALAVSPAELETAVDKAGAYLLNTVKRPQVGSIGGEWAVIGLARGGYAVPQNYWDGYYAAVEDYVKACEGVLHERKYTEYSRLIVALTAIGADPTDVGGYNLLTPLGDFDKTVWQGINGPIWALIALDSGNYDMPVNFAAATQATRQRYIDEILSRQLESGGWSLTAQGGAADPDVTGMALQALAKYQDQGAVKTAVDAALACLSGQQDAQGGYAGWGAGNSESVAQVIVALCELGVSLDDPHFEKNGNTLLDHLLSYQQSDGSFLHTGSGSGGIQMVSEQGFYALAAARRAAEGKSSLYRMDDVTITVSGNVGAGAAGLSGKHADVRKTAVTAPGLTFDDISAHENQAAMEALAVRGVIAGKGDGVFAPDATMTRAEFAAIVVRALGLTPKAGDAFSDVTADKWYAPYIGTAYAYGLIQGVGDGIFDPAGAITRQQAAVLVARAAALCGMETGLEDDEIRNTLAQFTDYVTVAAWAREGVAFCYSADILNQSDLRIEPSRAILRCEIAQMLYHLLGSAKLL